MSKVIIIGGGAAGMMAGIVAARNGNKTDLFEKKRKLGKKLYITGKGRCNLTNASERDAFLDKIVHNKKFFFLALLPDSQTGIVSIFLRNAVFPLK
jgi:predicted flavoprotein YhiN